ncbi:MAG TPA: PilZ domain-containing protein, partial [Polyangiaceae bacterium]|nr:PilZ domain-containing protein [Polyangiaceae bacterium]
MPPDDERRLHERYRAWLPARIGGESVEMQLAIGHDMSQGGALLVTRTELAVGD